MQGRSCAPREPADVCLERQKAETGQQAAGLRFFDQPRRYEATPPRVAGSEAGGSGEHVGETVGSGSQRVDDGERETAAKNQVQTAAVGLHSAPTKATSSAGGGLSSFFRRIWNRLG